MCVYTYYTAGTEPTHSARIVHILTHTHASQHKHKQNKHDNNNLQVEAHINRNATKEYEEEAGKMGSTMHLQCNLLYTWFILYILQAILQTTPWPFNDNGGCVGCWLIQS